MRALRWIALAAGLVSGARWTTGAPAPKAFRCEQVDPVRLECVCASGQFPDRTAQGEAICAELRAPWLLSPEDGAELEAPAGALTVAGPRGALQIEVEVCAGPAAAPARCERLTVPVRPGGRAQVPLERAAGAPGEAQRWRARAWRGARVSAWSAPRRFTIRPRPAPAVVAPAAPPVVVERFVGVHLGVPVGLDEGVAFELPRLEIAAGKVWRRRGGPATGVVALGWLDARSRVALSPAGRGRGAATDLTLAGAAAALVLRWDDGRVPLLLGVGPAFQRAAAAGTAAAQLGATALAEVSIALGATPGAEWRISARARVDAYLRGSAGQLMVISLGLQARF